MLLMRLTAGVFIYLLLGITIVTLIVFGLYILVAPNSQNSALANSIGQYQIAAKIAGVVAIILGVVIAIMAFCFRSRLKLASSIVKVSSRFVQ
jgi:hypothetical protein